MTLEHEGHQGPRVLVFQTLHFSPLWLLFMVAAAGAEQSLGQQETPFASPPPYPCRLAGAGVSPSTEAHSGSDTD